MFTTIKEAACSSHTALTMLVLTVLEIFFVKLKSLWGFFFFFYPSSQSRPHLPLMHWRQRSTGMHFNGNRGDPTASRISQFIFSSFVNYNCRVSVARKAVKTPQIALFTSSYTTKIEPRVRSAAATAAAAAAAKRDAEGDRYSPFNNSAHTLRALTL